MTEEEYKAAIEQYKAEHSAGGSLEHGEWKKHKYIRIENGRYIYPEDVKKGTSGSNKVQNALNQMHFNSASAAAGSKERVNADNAGKVASKIEDAVNKKESDVTRSSNQTDSNSEDNKGSIKSALTNIINSVKEYRDNGGPEKSKMARKWGVDSFESVKVNRDDEKFEESLKNVPKEKHEEIRKQREEGLAKQQQSENATAFSNALRPKMDEKAKLLAKDFYYADEKKREELGKELLKDLEEINKLCEDQGLNENQRESRLRYFVGSINNNLATRREKKEGIETLNHLPQDTEEKIKEMVWGGRHKNVTGEGKEVYKREKSGTGKVQHSYTDSKAFYAAVYDYKQAHKR